MNPQNLFKYLHKIISLVLIIAFIGSSLPMPQVQAGEIVVLGLPAPGSWFI